MVKIYVCNSEKLQTMHKQMNMPTMLNMHSTNLHPPAFFLYLVRLVTVWEKIATDQGVGWWTPKTSYVLKS